MPEIKQINGKKTRISADFSISDADREWATKRSYPMFICDVFLPAFREYFTSENCRAPLKYDWHAALKTWVRSASPSGDKYSSALWERRCREAKQMEAEHFRRSSPKPYYDPAHRAVPMPVSTRQLVEKIRREKTHGS